MASVGVRELKEHTSEIMRRVREDGETIDITYRGEVVATILPRRRYSQHDMDRFWERQRQLVREAGERLGDRPIDVVELLREERREFLLNDMLPPDWRPNS